MVACVWLLIFLFTPVAFAEEQPPDPVNLCLDCHPVHYPELGGCVECHGGHPETRRQNIAHDGLIAARFAAFTLADSPVVERGRRQLKDFACRRCHVTAGKGNRVAANLDLATEYAAPGELAEAIAEPVLFMPDFRFTEEQRIALVNALLAGAQEVEIPAGEVPAVIHFEKDEGRDDIQFEKHCGGCHRVLTEIHGGLGSGWVGPNLSGLLSKFYPENFGAEQERWSVDGLEKWLKNPRRIRALTQMPPRILQPAEFKRLTEELQLREGSEPAPAVAPVTRIPAVVQ